MLHYDKRFFHFNTYAPLANMTGFMARLTALFINGMVPVGSTTRCAITVAFDDPLLDSAGVFRLLASCIQLY